MHTSRTHDDVRSTLGKFYTVSHPMARPVEMSNRLSPGVEKRDTKRCSWASNCMRSDHWWNYESFFVDWVCCHQMLVSHSYAWELLSAMIWNKINKKIVVLFLKRIIIRGKMVVMLQPQLPPLILGSDWLFLRDIVSLNTTAKEKHVLFFYHFKQKIWSDLCLETRTIHFCQVTHCTTTHYLPKSYVIVPMEYIYFVQHTTTDW